MLWPDDKALESQPWWGTPAWQDGPTFGALVSAARPAIRAALLLGYEVTSVSLGFGKGAALPGEWQMIDRGTLELLPGPWVSDVLPGEGPNLWLDVQPIEDLAEDFGGPYTVEHQIGVFSSDDYTADASVPAAITDAVEAFVEDAVGVLAPFVPARSDWDDAVEAGGGLLRMAGGSLLWMLDPAYWYGLGEAASGELQRTVEELIDDTEGFLRGQLHGDRSRHVPSANPGPANLEFLFGREMLFGPGRAHKRFWEALLAELQGRGEAHRLLERARTTYTGEHAPTWLDVLSELVLSGVVYIDGLFEPPEPPEAVTAEMAAGHPVREITLTAWGVHKIVLRREMSFLDQPNEGLEGSVAWDYIPGDAQVKPTVLLVAGRGVAIEHKIDKLDGRPWALEIYRVQDDSLVPTPGSMIDTTALLTPIPIEPWPIECVTDPSDPVEPSTLEFPQLLAKPHPHGVTLVYPIVEGVVPIHVLGPFEAAITPSVVELTVEPLSGTAAYALDVHYFTGLHIDVPQGEAFNGGTHVSVWTTGPVTIRSFESDNTTPAAGNPSVVSRTVTGGYLFVAELWQMEVAAGQSGGQHPLPRPWSMELPVTLWADLFELSMLVQVLQVMWTDLFLQEIPDLFLGHDDDPFAETVERLDYDKGSRRATWHDPTSGEDFVLTPAAHAHGDFGAYDNVFYDLIDVGTSLIPFVGDAADIGELIHAWQTGRDRWGRPVNDFQLALMFVGACAPFVSGVVVRGIGQALADAAEMVPRAQIGRLFTTAYWGTEWSVTQARAALAQTGLFHPATAASGSRKNRQLAETLVRTLDEHTEVPDSSTLAAFGRDLVGGTSDGWLTVDDVIIDNGAGFVTHPLQTAYTRYLREHPGTSPRQFMEEASG
jgi:hypothetical protein